ncbi:hypothetical protein B0H15DRAFT_807732 [Mycena belliarum]|uniref:Uncharacterized protein n=1 Tax=Mycena belliarum TaxID=1033014 RepID=A0AAD6TMQ9_9AGAR|nr:hypothetical protein B0H15DRAFT_807732 [Mycena belliae]
MATHFCICPHGPTTVVVVEARKRHPRAHVHERGDVEQQVYHSGEDSHAKAARNPDQNSLPTDLTLCSDLSLFSVWRPRARFVAPDSRARRRRQAKSGLASTKLLKDDPSTFSTPPARMSENEQEQPLAVQIWTFSRNRGAIGIRHGYPLGARSLDEQKRALAVQIRSFQRGATEIRPGYPLGARILDEQKRASAVQIRSFQRGATEIRPGYPLDARSREERERTTAATCSPNSDFLKKYARKTKCLLLSGSYGKPERAMYVSPSDLRINTRTKASNTSQELWEPLTGTLSTPGVMTNENERVHSKLGLHQENLYCYCGAPGCWSGYSPYCRSLDEQNRGENKCRFPNVDLFKKVGKLKQLLLVGSYGKPEQLLIRCPEP